MGRKIAWLSAFILGTYLILLIPEPGLELPKSASKKPFVWNQDAYWSSLEKAFIDARGLPEDSLLFLIDSRLGRIEVVLDSAGQRLPLEPNSYFLTILEDAIFVTAPLIAVRPERLPQFAHMFNRLRVMIKEESLDWDMNSPEARDRVYRLLYGGRAAIEEIMLQAPGVVVPVIMPVRRERQITPHASLKGVTIHSGDILVSRGGAPTSALIARGNDYPGNFSHVALAHVDQESGAISIIESHIECGVTISRAEDYLKDTKLRIMVLRLRDDPSDSTRGPMLPHEAASAALAGAKREHIPYDFEMDFARNDKLFCSEVASAAYAELGIYLWMGRSNISAKGIASWLAAFGVRHFETQEPSDLEYDPQLWVVAEWRDPETLFKDHVDNAVIDAMLERADQGLRLKYDWYLLPLARVSKAYSWMLNIFGGVGPVPEGMNAASALRNKWFSSLHARIKQGVLEKAARFEAEKGYRPPYWELVRLARESMRNTL